MQWALPICMGAMHNRGWYHFAPQTTFSRGGANQERRPAMARTEKNRGIFRNAYDRLIEARTRQARALVEYHARQLDHEILGRGSHK